VAFCRELMDRKLDITWSLPTGTRSEAIDGEVPALLVASGCHHVTYAPESGSERILGLIEKRVHLDHLEQSVRDSLAAGLTVCLFILIGFPQEEREDIRRTFTFMRRMARLGVHEIALSTFVPLPGTALFDTTRAIAPFVVDDEYCYWMTGATSLFGVRSWNPRISARRLLLLKYWGLMQFFGISYLHHPRRFWRLLANAVRGKQETKVDRVIHEIAVRFGALRGKPVAPAAKPAHS
jgi:anaerobic magnesium-protoporphyrin IX monomethyl ester cyclase